MKKIFKPQMSQIDADGDVAENRIPTKILSSNHLRKSAPFAVNLLQSGGEE